MTDVASDMSLSFRCPPELEPILPRPSPALLAVIAKLEFRSDEERILFSETLRDVADHVERGVLVP
jgi:hypothetical protein